MYSIAHKAHSTKSDKYYLRNQRSQGRVELSISQTSQAAMNYSLLLPIRDYQHQHPSAMKSGAILSDRGSPQEIGSYN